MDKSAIILGLLGIMIIIFPKYIRQYKAYELGKKVSRTFIAIQRVTGVIFIAVATLLIIFNIK